MFLHDREALGSLKDLFGTIVILFVHCSLEDVILFHGIDAMMYANDSQLYIFLNREKLELKSWKPVLTMS